LKYYDHQNERLTHCQYYPNQGIYQDIALAYDIINSQNTKMLNKNREDDLIKEVKNNLTKSMQLKAEKLLNSYSHHLSSEAKKRKG